MARVTLDLSANFAVAYTATDVLQYLLRMLYKSQTHSTSGQNIFPCVCMLTMQYLPLVNSSTRLGGPTGVYVVYVQRGNDVFAVVLWVVGFVLQLWCRVRVGGCACVHACACVRVCVCACV